MRKPLLFTLTFALITLVCQAQKTDYSFKETYPVSNAPKVSLYTSDGDVKVHASSNNQVQIFYTARRHNRTLKISKAELEKEFDFIVTHSQNNLEVKIKEKKRMRNYGNSINIHLEVYVPTQTACNLHSSDGNIMIKGLTNRQSLRTSDGDIKIMQVKGDIIARTSDGNITFEDVAGSIDLTTSDGSIHGNLTELKNSLKARTSDGNIRIALPKQQGLDLDIRGESLNIPLQNFSGKATKKRINGKMNGGGKLIQMRTSDGRIKLDM
ncbi:DUF4097 family beta strand repeat-containing protein [Microscilla marina]|uniref:DUF4097 domain-containing protein n=1 Tax=Microscilla marina ATCC 23134 TaxID=313606 RepID=A1ZL87_MICM2|nr:DUF4097 family beta strand repeat-containing protein [Microscilla marina]EAY29053.1 conserved hypothetical protein [Microscilla marina ATCC 23134]